MEKTFIVTCLVGGETDRLVIDTQRHLVLDFGKGANTPFLSVRWRGDLNWGFECICGNDSRLAIEEEKDFDKLVYGSRAKIQAITDSLKIADKNRFTMELA